MLGIKRTQSDLELLNKVPVVRPEKAKGRWKGTSHKDLIEELKAQIKDRNWRMKCPRFEIARGGADLVFSCVLLTGDVATIKVGRGMEDDVDHLYPAIGVAVSNARRRRLTFYSGLSRLKGLGALVLSKWTGPSYTHFFGAEGAIQHALEAWKLSQPGQTAQVNDLAKRERLRLDEAEDLLLQAAHDQAMPWSRIPRVLDISSGRKNYRDGSVTVQPIELMLAFSAVCDMNPPSRQMDQQFLFNRSIFQYLAEPAAV